MSMSRLLEECEARPLKLDDLSAFDRESLLLFTNEDLVDDPFIDCSFSHDISQTNKQFMTQKERIPGATLTAFLFWCAAKAMCEIRHPNFRLLGGKWYELMNPLFFMPLATGNESRLASFAFRNVKKMSFEGFVASYQEMIEKAKRGEIPPFGSIEVFNIAHHLSSLPNLRFTNVKAQTARRKSTHMWWTFGQVYEQDRVLQVPMTVRMHHANGDPVILERLLKSFEQTSQGSISHTNQGNGASDR